MHYLLFYEVVPGYAERREPYRMQHIAMAQAAARRGELVLGGATGEQTDGALLLFKGDSARVAEGFAEADPYVLNGIVTGWHVKPWKTVVGEGADRPLPPVE